MKVSRFIQSICLIFSLLIFVGCDEIQKIIDELKQPPSVIAPQLQPISTEQEIKPFLGSQGPNCPIDDFDIPGEGYKAYGMSGGITALGASMPVEGETRAPQKSMDDIAALVDLGGLEQSAALIILDDFNGSVSTSIPSVFAIGKEVFSLLDSTLSSDLATRATEIEQITQQLEARKQLSHGAMVLNHSLSLLQELESRQTLFGDYGKLESDGLVEYKTQKDSLLLVQGVDTEDLDTSFIATRLEDTLDDLKLNKGIGRIAVNMSFAIVPCGVLQDFQASDIPDFESYAKKLADANKASLQGAYTEAEFLEIITELISTPNGNDPLIQFIERQKEFSRGDSQVYVASSGNYGLPYSMYLGAVENIVSVSASRSEDPNSKKSFSNKGEVMEVGAWFRLRGVAEFRDIQPTDVIYAGTSYSAPNVSVFSALDLMQSTPKCSPDQTSKSNLVQLNGSSQPVFNDKVFASAVSGC